MGVGWAEEEAEADAAVVEGTGDDAGLAEADDAAFLAWLGLAEADDAAFFEAEVGVGVVFEAAAAAAAAGFAGGDSPVSGSRGLRRIRSSSFCSSLFSPGAVVGGGGGGGRGGVDDHVRKATSTSGFAALQWVKG